MRKPSNIDSPEVEPCSDRVDQIADQLVDSQQRLQLVRSEGRPVPDDIGLTIDDVSGALEKGAARALEASRMLLRQHGVPETEIR